MHQFSPRERQVLEALAARLATKQVADQMGVVTKYIRTYIKGIYHELQVRNRPELLSRTVRDGS